MKNKLPILKYILIFSISFIILLCLLNLLLTTTAPFGFKVSQDNDWISFWGTVIGAIFGSSATLIGIILTIKHGEKRANENDRLKLLPYLIFDYNTKSSSDQVSAKKGLITLISQSDTFEIFAGKILIKNVGLNSALNLTIKYPSFEKHAYLHDADFGIDILEKGETYQINIIANITVKPLTDITPENKHNYTQNQVFIFKLVYNDFLDNKYEQELKLNFRTNLIINTPYTDYIYESNFYLDSPEKPILSKRKM